MFVFFFLSVWNQTVRHNVSDLTPVFWAVAVSGSTTKDINSALCCVHCINTGLLELNYLYVATASLENRTVCRHVFRPRERGGAEHRGHWHTDTPRNNTKELVWLDADPRINFQESCSESLTLCRSRRCCQVERGFGFLSSAVLVLVVLGVVVGAWKGTIPYTMQAAIISLFSELDRCSAVYRNYFKEM